MGIFTVYEIKPRSAAGYILVSEPSVEWDGIIHHAASRYGFREHELSFLKEVGDWEDFLLLVSSSKGAKIIRREQLAIQGEFIIGVCSGRPLKDSLVYLREMGFNPKSSISDRNMRIDSDDYLELPSGTYKVEYLLVKSSDIITGIYGKRIDAVMCYGDVWYNLPEPNYNIKYIGSFVDNLGNGKTRVSLVGKSKMLPANPLIMTEYRDGKRLLDQNDLKDKIKELGLNLNVCTFEYVHGSAESYLHCGKADLAITVVQTGKTLEDNNLVELAELRKIYLNLWVHLNPFDRLGNRKYYEFYTELKPKEKLKYLVVEGIDGSGKSTLLKELQTFPEAHNVVCFDRLKSICRTTLKPFDEWPQENPAVEALPFASEENTHVIILDVDPKICHDRMVMRGGKIEKYEEIDALYYFRLRYRELAGFYGFNVLRKNSVSLAAIEIIKGSKRYTLPALRNGIDCQNFKVIVEGESKKVVEYDDFFDLITYKPSVYSHKNQRHGTIEGSDLERQRTTRNILYLLALAEVPHTYWCIYNGIILAERIRDVVVPRGVVKNPPPVEVCVKRYHVGTHKHIYRNMETYLTRSFEPLCNEHGIYRDPIVRFDWRNPNHLTPPEGGNFRDMPHAQIYVNPLKAAGKTPEEIEDFLKLLFPRGIPMGDCAMAEGLADKYIDVQSATRLVLRAFLAMESHFARMGIRFKDVCFMPDICGTKLYGEVSQDCGRYEYIDADKLSSLDKDVWRAGGSSDLVLEKWKKLSIIIDDYVKNFFRDWHNSVGL